MSKKSAAPDADGRLAVSIEEGALMIGVSRTKLYQMIRAKRLRARKLGPKRVVLLIADLQRLLDEAPAA